MAKGVYLSLALAAGLLFVSHTDRAEAAVAAPALKQGMAQSSAVEEVRWRCGPRRCWWTPGYVGVVPGFALGWGPPDRPDCYWKRGILGNWKYKCD